MDYKAMYDIFMKMKREMEYVNNNGYSVGFMRGDGPYDLPPDVTNPYIDCTKRQEKINKLLSVDEYLVLTRTTYRSPKADIENMIKILQNLVDKGVFDDEFPYPLSNNID